VLLLLAAASVAMIFGADRATAQAASSTDATASPAASTPSSGVTVSKTKTNIVSSGDGTANTGRNTLNGNASDNTGDSTQRTSPGGGSQNAVLSNTSDTRNSSSGSADLTTGDAQATGSDSTGNVAQQLNAGGGVTLTDQRAIVVNDGDAIANSGRNDVTGNASLNDADLDQRAGSDRASVLSNNARTTNQSDGSAGVKTGDADATGSRSATGVNQWANVVGNGTGGVNFTDQSARVSNAGDALANTGNNTATGNLSLNLASTDQRATSARGPPTGRLVLTNFAVTTNWSRGSASITTGAATANGNDSETTITQASNSVMKSGLAFPDQRVLVQNEGDARALTGNNAANGNASLNAVDTAQRSGVFGDTIRVRDVVASNFATTTNDSSGRASITTGEACANGNTSSTAVAQRADAVIETGFTFIDQRANLTTDGDGTADTGRNLATGNNSLNVATTDQRAGLFATPDDGAAVITARDLLAVNIADSTNRSDGSASVTTGAATACGNVTHDRIEQAAGFVNDPGFAFIDQRARINNDGDAVASTGSNRATGNDSLNAASTDQRSGAFARGGEGTDISIGTGIGIGAGGDARITLRDVTATSIATTANESNGSASISTGAAMASGNFSSSSLGQSAGVAIAGDGFAFVDQRERVTNHGDSVADTGRNAANGNTSFNDASTDQTTGAFARGGDGLGVGVGIGTGVGIGIGIGGDAVIRARDVVATGFATTRNASNGSAGIATGSATAYGNYATTAADQTAPVAIGGAGFAFVDQAARITNDGDSVASTGRNTATGNDSLNLADTTQDTGLFARGGDGTGVGIGVGFGLRGLGFGLGLGIGIGGDARMTARDVTAAGFSDTHNASDGSASITTGSATAYGNYAATTVNDGQVAAVSIGGQGFTFVDQIVRVNNDGDGTADSGRNNAVGNISDNVATTDQGTGAFVQGGDGTALGVGVGVGLGGLGLGIGIGIGVGGDAIARAQDVTAASFANTTNASNGTASITTGATTAYGNYATTAVDQNAPVAIGGAGFAFVDQVTRINNSGDAVASTGRNQATGNSSENVAATSQDSGLFANGGDGTALGVGVGFTLGGIGVGVGAGIGIGGDAITSARDVVATGFADTSSTSDGRANIATGAATAYGNYSSTAVNSGQVADVAIAGKGFTFVDQSARVTNDGDGTADTGRNTATGNDSVNLAVTDQDTGFFAVGGEGTGVGIGLGFSIGGGGIGIGVGIGIGGDATARARNVVAAATADNHNTSNGSAGIVTGAATAFGNVSASAIDQVATVDIVDTGLSFVDQRVAVVNDGDGIARTGRNQAVGNSSVNTADTSQSSGLFAEGGDGTGVGFGIGLPFGIGIGIAAGGDATVVTTGNLVATNMASNGNVSDGSASVTTGSALARGNYSATNVVQAVHDPALLEFTDQAIAISNEADATADSGNNTARGNTSVNDTTVDHEVGTFATGGEADATAIAFLIPLVLELDFPGSATIRGTGNSVQANFSDTTNASNGSSSIRTGAAEAFGSVAVTSACSGRNVDVDCPVATLPRIVPPPPPPPCPCVHMHELVPVPVPPVPVPRRPVPNVAQLPVTGGPLAAQAVIGLLLVALGSLLRRRKAQLA
jgi:hypothetical protein